MNDQTNHIKPSAIRDGCVTITGMQAVETRIHIAQEELRSGMQAILEYPKSITMYGSARLTPDSEYCQLAQRIANRAATAGYAVVSGGGPGIMQAANRGAAEAGGVSIGMTIALPHEQYTNPYVNIELPFYYFYTRKTCMSFSSECYLAFPGGFGTFDEIFELITLIQTGKTPPTPIILVGVRFWQPFIDAIRQVMLDDFATISAEDMNLFTVTDDEDIIAEIIQNAPLRNTALSAHITDELPAEH
jgi:uncharacterized protein (TIGR00730 family)